jgi:3-dehydroquinate synthase
VTETVTVPLGERAYDVVVGTGLLARLDSFVPPSEAATAVVVTNRTVDALYGQTVRDALGRIGLATHTVEVPDGETAKSIDTLAMLYHRFAAAGLRRDDLVVALGGGVVGDLAGFAAATWHRGVAVLQLPTTLLAQVDSSLGGKTGINLPEGKNLVGAFHQPVAVVADTSALATLPVRELRAGLGEVAKYGFIADPVVLDLLERHPDEVIDGDPDLLTEIVRRGVAVKARVVAADERESGERALLNYGHTFGHAIEAITRYEQYLHGEAVALGMVAAAHLGERLGITEAGTERRTRAILERLGLPTGGIGLDPARVWEHVGRDKKAKQHVRFVVCVTPGRAVVVDDPPRDDVDAAVAALA